MLTQLYVSRHGSNLIVFEVSSLGTQVHLQFCGFATGTKPETEENEDCDGEE